jgi:hypothetical protein
MRRLYVDALVAACMGEEVGRAEDIVRLVIFFFETCGHAKAIYKRRKPPFAVCVGKKMECLEALARECQT